MKTHINSSSSIIVVTVLAAHVALLGYCIYGAKAEAKMDIEQPALVFVEIPSTPAGPTQSQTIEEQQAGKTEQKKAVRKKTENKPVVQHKQITPTPKTPVVNTTKTKAAVNDAPAQNSQNTKTDKSNTEKSQNTSTEMAQNSSQGKGNASGSGTGNSSSSTPAGGGDNSNTVIDGGSVVIKGSYSDQALKEGLQGVVGISFTVMPNGKVSNATVISPSGSRVLDKDALRTVNATKNIRPKTINGQAVKTNYKTRIVYKLS